MCTGMNEIDDLDRGIGAGLITVIVEVDVARENFSQVHVAV